MINIGTTTEVKATGFSNDFAQRKQVTLRMDADDAFSLATILMNSDLSNLTEDWQQTISALSRSLIDAGNRCRP